MIPTDFVQLMSLYRIAISTLMVSEPYLGPFFLFFLIPRLVKNTEAELVMKPRHPTSISNTLIVYMFTFILLFLSSKSVTFVLCIYIYIYIPVIVHNYFGCLRPVWKTHLQNRNLLHNSKHYYLISSS